jgi:hypothetical protein
MRHFFYFILVSFIFISCMDGDDGNTPSGPFPTVVFLDLSVHNETQAPIAVGIRHKYLWCSYGWQNMQETNTVILYTDWVKEQFEIGESMSIGIEKEAFGVRGFVLLDEKTDHLKRIPLFISSFELEIENTNNKIFIPGFVPRYVPNSIENLEQNEDDICKLRANRFTMEIITNKESLFLKAEGYFIIPITLTIKEGGSYSFEYGEIKNGK